VDNVYVKDLNSLGRPLPTTIIVDNSIHAFACNITNGVPIPSYFGQPWDNEL
jgi:TFIIF-interacting CTD phosphatase-like protein